MSIPINFNYNNEQHIIHLAITKKPSEKTVTISGHDYQIVGSNEDVTLLKIYIASLPTEEFDNIGTFEATLDKLSNHEKISGIFTNKIVTSDVNVPLVEVLILVVFLMQGLCFL